MNNDKVIKAIRMKRFRRKGHDDDEEDEKECLEGKVALPVKKTKTKQYGWVIVIDSDSDDESDDSMNEDAKEEGSEDDDEEDGSEDEDGSDGEGVDDEEIDHFSNHDGSGFTPSPEPED